MKSRRPEEHHVRGMLIVVPVLLVAVIAIMVSWNQTSPPILVIAYGSLLASLTALFKDPIANWIWGPRLSVSYEPNEDYCEQVILASLKGQSMGYYFRLLVRNLGHLRAENVEVLATNLYAFDEEGCLRGPDKTRLFT